MRREWWKQFSVGTRVRFTQSFGDYPVDPVRVGEVGTVASVHGGDPETQDTYVAVKLDLHHPDLDEWENEIHVWVWEAKFCDPNHNLEAGEDCPFEAI